LARYVLAHLGSESWKPGLALIERHSGVTILDRSVPGTLLVEASAETARGLREQLQDWTVAEEVTYPRPGPARQRFHREEPGEPR
jgi:hypothetical protein